MAIDDNFITYNSNLDETPPAIWPAFGLPLIEELPDPFPLEKLKDEQFREIVRRLVSEAVRCNQVRDALELIHRLRLVENLKLSDPQTYNFYHRLIILLKFVSFMSRRQKTAISLLTESVVFALRANVEVVNNLKDYLEVYEGEIGTNKEMRRELVYALENNKEKIGEQLLTIAERGQAAPTLENWLKKYNESQHLIAERTKFNQINFLNTESSARLLTNEDKRILSSLLEMYDMLLFPPRPNIVIVDEQDKVVSDDAIDKYIIEQHLELPDDVFRGGIEENEESQELGIKSLGGEQGADAGKPFAPANLPVSIPPAIKLPLPIKLPPIKRSWELGIKKQELEVKSQESRIKSQELGIKSEEEGKQISKTGQALNVPLPPTPKVVNQAEAKPAGKAAEEVDLGKVELSKVIDARLEKLKQRKRGK